MIETLVQGSVALASFFLSLQLTGDHTPDMPWWRKAAGIGYGVLGLWLGLMLLSSAVPVVLDMHAPVIERGPGHVALSVTANQRRARDCRLQYAMAELVYADGLPAKKTGIEMLDGPDPTGVRSDGLQWLGDWRVRFEFNRQITGIKILSHYYCGILGGSVVETSGPFPVD